LVILSDVEGLLDKDKKTVIRRVEHITEDIVGLAETTKRRTSVGGMITKIKAARITVESGIPCVIAHGRAEQVLTSLAKDLTSIGTVFLPKEGGLKQRDRWMVFSSRPKGCIRVDDGAKRALQNKKSLLSVGVAGVEGDFHSGDVVGIVGADGIEFARGIANVHSSVLCGLCGKHSDKEVVHCDNIVMV
jgi:glutamate 5-kinase